MGFVRGQAYLSRLAYHVARAEAQDPARIDCPACAAAAGARDGGWCERCGIGRIGVLAVRDRADLDQLQKAIGKLRRSLDALERCETCAIAAFADGRCRACNLAYQDGEPMPRSPASGSAQTSR
jgi:hypothetical protein